MRENRMGTMKIPKLIFTISFPIMISMFIQAMYNIVDSYFIGKINEQAFSALALAYPIQNIMIGISVGTGVGMNSILSKYLGEKDFHGVNRAAENGLALAIIYGVIFFILSLFLPKIYLSSQTSNEAIINYGIEYLRIVMGLSIGVFLQINAERLLQSTGKSVLSMISQASGAIINIILDPILIFGYFGFPSMGVSGAALATVIGQMAGSMIGYLLHYFLNKEIRLKKPSLNFEIVKKIYIVGFPSTVVTTIFSATIYFLNKIVANFSDSSIAALGAYFKVQNFAFMPILGLNNGVVPILAYNYGARYESRIRETMKLAIIFAMTIMFFETALIHIFAERILDVFSATKEMKEVGIPMLKIASVSFTLAGASVVGSGIFQAFGNGVLSLVDSIIRQIVIMLPFAYLMARLGNINAVWWGYTIAEIVSVIFVAYFIKTFVYKKIGDMNKVEL